MLDVNAQKKATARRRRRRGERGEPAAKQRRRQPAFSISLNRVRALRSESAVFAQISFMRDSQFQRRSLSLPPASETTCLQPGVGRRKKPSSSSSLSCKRTFKREQQKKKEEERGAPPIIQGHAPPPEKHRSPAYKPSFFRSSQYTNSSSTQEMPGGMCVCVWILRVCVV